MVDLVNALARHTGILSDAPSPGLHVASRDCRKVYFYKEILYHETARSVKRRISTDKIFVMISFVFHSYIIHTLHIQTHTHIHTYHVTYIHIIFYLLHDNYYGQIHSSTSSSVSNLAFTIRAIHWRIDSGPKSLTKSHSCLCHGL